MEKQRPKSDDPKQSERFVEDAHRLEVDESGKSFERALRKVVPKQRPKKRGKP
jgi:hypothetical protein